MPLVSLLEKIREEFVDFEISFLNLDMVISIEFPLRIKKNPVASIPVY